MGHADNVRGAEGQKNRATPWDIIGPDAEKRIRRQIDAIAIYECPLCNEPILKFMNYCPKCGVRIEIPEE